MLTNYVVTSVFFAEPQSVAVPYSVFRAQLEAGNIAELTSTGDSIRGRFKSAVTYPVVATADGARPEHVRRQPSEAEDVGPVQD